MRVALFTEVFLPKIDGIVTRLKNTVAELQKQGDEVLIFAPGDGPDEYCGAQIVRMGGYSFPLYPELKLALPRRFIRQHLTRFRPDVIHAADPAVLGIAGIYYADVLNIPLVASYHTRLPKYVHSYGLGRLEPLAWALVRLRHRKAQLNLCTSQMMNDELVEHGVRNLAVWQKAVDTDAFHPRFKSATMRSRLSDGNPADPLLLYVGRISPEKGIERLRPVLDRNPAVRLALVGGGPHQQKLVEHFQGRKVKFAGYLSGEPLAEAMASCDALVLPSETETLGLVLIEGMASGTVVIGANAGGIPDVIEDGKTGLLFDPLDPDDLQRVVATLLADKDSCHAMRTSARAAAEQWSWAAATRQLRQFYAQAIATDRPSRSGPDSISSRAAKALALGTVRLLLR